MGTSASCSDGPNISVNLTSSAIGSGLSSTVLPGLYVPNTVVTIVVTRMGKEVLEDLLKCRTVGAVVGTPHTSAGTPGAISVVAPTVPLVIPTIISVGSVSPGISGVSSVNVTVDAKLWEVLSTMPSVRVVNTISSGTGGVPRGSATGSVVHVASNG